jgi:putative membrane protein
MIAHFSDHTANERTFLAWVRTAIAVMAFGFLVAKFDLFLKIAARSLAGSDRQTISLSARILEVLSGPR